MRSDGRHELSGRNGGSYAAAFTPALSDPGRQTPAPRRIDRTKTGSNRVTNIAA